MDILNLAPSQLYDFAKEYKYTTNRMAEKLMPAEKTKNINVKVRQIADGGQIPSIALAHSLNTEARIGNRVDFEEYVYSKLLIKEKLDTSERIIEAYNGIPDRDAVMEYVYNDANTLFTRVMTRAEVARMEILGTGKATYDENNVKKEVDYHIPAGNIFNGATNNLFKDWDTAGSDIIGALNAVKMTAARKGYKVVRAITSTTVLGYMMTNTAILNIFKNTVRTMTPDAIKGWLFETFGIEFLTNDEVYKVDAKDTQVHRMYPEMAITFLTTMGSIGASLYGYTAEELAYRGEKSERSYCMLTSWVQDDPCITWTKAAALFVPVLKDVNGIFIAKITT